MPSVDGPIPVDATQQTFKAALQYDLPPGWVDEEFFISCASPAITYTTAVFVRRPEDPSRTAGVVAVEPLHGTGIWGLLTQVQPYLVEEGYAHVGIAASSDTAEIVQSADPARYASLTVPPTPDATNEIIAGVGALLHQRRSPLLPGVKVTDTILGGWSQTAGVTRDFMTSPQGRGTIDGKRLYDGYFPGQAAVGSSGRAQVPALPDVGVPVIELQGERELFMNLEVYGGLGYRRPDSKTYRLYEVPGMSHINNEPDNPVSGFAGGLTCEWPPGATPSQFPQTQMWRMAFDNLARWVTEGTPAPRADRIQLDADGTAVATDAHGNARGGVRSVAVDVPTASIVATSRAPGGLYTNPCAYTGYQLNYDQAQLQQLYGTHRGYARRVARTADRLVRDGFLLPDAARQLTAAARDSDLVI